MKLKYRGITYESNPTEVTTIKGKVGGKYRGVPWIQTIPQITQVDRPSIELKYRGVPYCKGAVKLNKSAQLAELASERRLTDVKAESVKTAVTHPEMLSEQPSKPKRLKVKH